MKDYYQVLGLKKGAGQAEIKKAYFRLIRQHSPEADPEGFREIREAYEYLKNAPEEEETLTFPLFKDSFAGAMARQIEECRQSHDYRKARDTAEEGNRYYPDSEFFLFQLQQMQRMCGNTGKAVTTGEELVRRWPKNKWYWREYALSLLERGWCNKAMPAMEKAYDLGCRDLDFVLTYSIQCGDYQNMEGRIIECLSEIVYRDTKWKKDKLQEVNEAYTGLLVTINERNWNEKESLRLNKELFERFLSFLEEYRSQLSGTLKECLDNLDAFMDGLFPVWDSDYQNKVEKTLDDLVPFAGSEEEKEEIRHFRGYLAKFRIEKDESIPRSLEYMYEIITFGDPTVKRLATPDAVLCMLKERELILEAEDHLKKEYPALYKEVKTFIDRMRDEKSRAVLEIDMLNQCRKLPDYEEMGNYLIWYPEEKEKFYGKMVASGEETYQRSGKKIGRNDPCPCGSGKKFKQCCMGKGIYD